MIGRCPKCGEVLYDNGRFYGCHHHEKHDLDERAAIKEFCGGEKRKAAEAAVIKDKGIVVE